MTTPEHLFLWIGTHFTTEIYMVSTKMQGILWSAADIVLVGILLKIVALARMKTHKRRIFFRYLGLLLSAIMTPLLAVARSPRQFLILESIICGIQFSILIYTIIWERKALMEMIGHVLPSNNRTSPPPSR